MNLKVVIPSHKRANRVRATKAIAGAIICVPESQADAYRTHNKDVEVVAHPDTVLGVAPKRQWIYDKFGDVFMVDDDVTTFMRLYRPSAKNAKMTPEEARGAVEGVAYLARDMGAYLFAVKSYADPRVYMPQEPFRVTGYMSAVAMGILAGSKLFFLPDMVVGEDYFISGLNAYHHRFCVIDNRFGVVFEKAFHNPGGLSDYRTVESEKQATITLKKMFGDAIQIRKKSRPFGQDRAGSTPYARHLIVPF